MKIELLKKAVVPTLLVIGVPLLLFPIATNGFHPDANKSGMYPFLIVLVGLPLLVGYFGLKSLALLIFSNLGLGVAMFMISLADAYRPDSLLMFGFMALSFYWLLFIVFNIIGLFRFESLIPLALSVLTVIAVVYSVGTGHRLRYHVFQRRLAQYQEAVNVIDQLIEDESLLLYGDEIPEQFRHLAHRISAERKNDVLAVTFFWGGGFPAKHTAFSYVSSGSVLGKDSGFAYNWPHATRINKYWFKVGN